MTCRELERLFVAGAPDDESLAHVSTCGACGAAAAAQEKTRTLTAELDRPMWSATLRESLLSIPKTAITCATADEWLAQSLEGELGNEQRQRLGDHRSRCGGCAAAAQALGVVESLESPQPAPWMSGRIAAVARGKSSERAGNRRGWLPNPRAAIAIAYAAALVLMIAGFNPADLARRAVPARLGQGTKAVITEVKTSAVDRIGVFEERAMRTLAVWRGRAGGYGRAALSQAIQLVMKSEPASPRSRLRNGEEKGALPKSEAEIMTWRA